METVKKEEKLYADVIMFTLPPVKESSIEI